jgi:hypothetical protein
LTENAVLERFANRCRRMKSPEGPAGVHLKKCPFGTPSQSAQNVKAAKVRAHQVRDAPPVVPIGHMKKHGICEIFERILAIVHQLSCRRTVSKRPNE